MKIQDFQLTPSYSIYHDGMQYCCQIHFDDQSDSEPEELFADSEEELARKVSECWKKYFKKQMEFHRC
ncbi:hypothetical protein [Scytonema sp. PRP1]|uniref:hypothetical protein n=1 Tax=Scytonema sp. PRP1 TaxID=3120513 RepID=UPI00300D852E